MSTVAHVTVTDWIALGLTSGLASAVFNQLAGGLLAKFQRSSDQRHQRQLQESEQAFQSRMQSDAREHESMQLLIKSHFEQRDSLLEAATESYNWLGFELVKNYGKDWDVFDYNEPKPKFNSVTEVIGSLRLIGQTHPTRSVRRLANELKNSIDSHYSSHIGYGEEFGEPILGGTPTVDKLSRWIEKCDDLIELMHEPPNLEDVRGPVDKHG